MSEITLPFHRKYRPKKFNQMVGNIKMIESVMSTLKAPMKPQVILMTGHAGTGKTTTARLLALEYLCTNRDIEKGACGECSTCKMVEEFIETGKNDYLPNLKEVDVTDSNKRQDIDILLEEAMTPSWDGEWKVFILDECHMLTNTAQNRLLKSLEEPAEKVLIVLCTTDPQKLIETIISRCQARWEVEKPNLEEMGVLLKKVCFLEGAKYDSKGLATIAVKGDFVPRKTLVALEQVIKQKGDANYVSAVEVLNVIAEEIYFEFYQYLLPSSGVIDILKYVSFISKIKMKQNLSQFVEGVIDYTKRGIYITHNVPVEGLDKAEIELYKRTIAKLSRSELAFLLNKLSNLRHQKDIETELLLLGYTGIKNQSLRGTQETTGGIVEVKESSKTLQNEKSEGVQNHLVSVTITPEQEKEMIDTQNKPVGADALAKMFGKSIVKRPSVEEIKEVYNEANKNNE